VSSNYGKQLKQATKILAVCGMACSDLRCTRYLTNELFSEKHPPASLPLVVISDFIATADFYLIFLLFVLIFNESTRRTQTSSNADLVRILIQFGSGPGDFQI